MTRVDLALTTAAACACIMVFATACGGRMPKEANVARGVFTRRAVLDEDAIYWVEAAGHGNQLPAYDVRKLPKVGGDPSTVATIALEAPEEQHHSLAALVAGTRRFIYFTSRSTSRLFRAAKSGGKVEELHVLGPPERHVTITALAGGEHGVFVMQQKHPGAAQGVKVAAGLVFIDDELLTTRIVAADACGEHVATDNRDVFWTESSSDMYIPCKGARLMKAPARGDGLPVVAAPRRNGIGALSLGPTDVFFVDESGLLATPKNAVGAEPSLVVRFFSAERMAVGPKRAVGVRDLTYSGTGPEQEVVLATLAGGRRQELAGTPKLTGAILSDGKTGYWFRSSPEDRNDVGLYRFELD